MVELLYFFYILKMAILFIGLEIKLLYCKFHQTLTSFINSFSKILKFHPRILILTLQNKNRVRVRTKYYVSLS